MGEVVNSHLSSFAKITQSMENHPWLAIASEVSSSLGW